MACDLHSEYGIDEESGILRERSWPWLLERIEGLLTADTRIRRLFAPEPDQPKHTTR